MGSEEIQVSSGNADARLFDTAGSSLLDSPGLIEFISANSKADPADLRLRLSGRELAFDLDFALTQIECRRKNARKLPYFISHPGFLFPSGLAAQQATDQEVARYHATLAPSGSRWLDLTAGLGIDALSAAIAGHRVTAVEIESWKCDVLRHNAEALLGQDSDFEAWCADSQQIAEETDSDEYDVIFIDPARRGTGDRRLYALADCMPDVTRLMPRLLSIAPRVIVKASPMLDVSEALRQLPSVSNVESVSHRGECKELLLICRRETRPRSFAARMIGADGAIESFEWQENPDVDACGFSSVSRPDKDVKDYPSTAFRWLYELDAALVKLRPDKVLSVRWPSLRKADPNTQLYLSEEKITEFPGRVTEIISRPAPRDLRKMKGEGMTVVSRNYPESAEAIRARYRFSENPHKFLYAFRLDGKPTMLLTELLTI